MLQIGPVGFGRNERACFRVIITNAVAIEVVGAFHPVTTKASEILEGRHIGVVGVDELSIGRVGKTSGKLPAAIGGGNRRTALIVVIIDDIGSGWSGCDGVDQPPTGKVPPEYNCLRRDYPDGLESAGLPGRNNCSVWMHPALDGLKEAGDWLHRTDW